MALPPLLGMRRKPPAHAGCPLRSRLFIPGLGGGDANHAQLVPGRRHVITIKRMAKSVQLACHVRSVVGKRHEEVLEGHVTEYQRISLSPLADIIGNTDRGQAYTF